MKRKIATLFALASVCMSTVNAQKHKIGVSAGYKTGEISFVKSDTLIYGFSVSVTKSEMFDEELVIKVPYRLENNSKYAPTLFGILGIEIKKASFMLKSGVVYVDLYADGKPKNPALHYATGIIVGYEVTKTIGVRVSVDNISKLMFGLTIKI